MALIPCPADGGQHFVNHSCGVRRVEDAAGGAGSVGPGPDHSVHVPPILDSSGRKHLNGRIYGFDCIDGRPDILLVSRLPCADVYKRQELVTIVRADSI